MCTGEATLTGLQFLGPPHMSGWRLGLLMREGGGDPLHGALEGHVLHLNWYIIIGCHCSYCERKVRDKVTALAV